MVRVIYVLVFVLLPSFAISQRGMSRTFGYGGSFDILNPINSSYYLPGASFFAEIPRNETVVPYVKVGYYLPQRVDNPGGAILTAIDPMTNPYQTTTTLDTRINTFSLEGGTRYFLGNDYDIGLAAMLESKIRLLISPTREMVGDYDASVYQIDPNSTIGDRYTSLTLFIGFGGGVKYSQPWGTVFTMAGLDLYILGNAITPLTSSMMFSMQVGFRRDLY